MARKIKKLVPNSIRVVPAIIGVGITQAAGVGVPFIGAITAAQSVGILNRTLKKARR